MTQKKRLKLYSHSRLDTFRTCPRKFFYSYIKHWQPSGKSAALIFGGAWHAAMDVIWSNHTIAATGDKKAIEALIDQAYKAFSTYWIASGYPDPEHMSADEIEDLGARTPATALEMLHHYVEARRQLFSDPTFELISVEEPFAVPLSPDDDSLFYVGKLDKCFLWRNYNYIGEHKSTTYYKKSGYFRNEFIDGFSPNAQVDGYAYQGYMSFGDKFKGVWIDAALVHRDVHKGFLFIPIERQYQMLENWLWTTHYYINQIEGNITALHERRELDDKYMTSFPMNTASCGNYGGCAYRDCCNALANPAKRDAPPLGFQVSKFSMFNELKLEKLGFTVDMEYIPTQEE